MLRLPLMVLVALLVALGSYLFLLPTGVQRGSRPGGSGRPAGHFHQGALSASGLSGGTVRLAWAPQLKVRTAPGIGGSPPRRVPSAPGGVPPGAG